MDEGKHKSRREESERSEEDVKRSHHRDRERERDKERNGERHREKRSRDSRRSEKEKSSDSDDKNEKEREKEKQRDRERAREKKREREKEEREIKLGRKGSLKFQFPRVGLLQNVAKRYPHSSVVKCGLRGGPRKSLWRKSVLSSEAIKAVHSLKLARAYAPRLQEVFNSRLCRLLKADLLDTLAALQRQNQLDLAL